MTKRSLDGVGGQPLPGSPHQQRPTGAVAAVRVQLFGGAGVDGHEPLAVELAPDVEDEPGAVEVLDVESDRFAAS